MASRWPWSRWLPPLLIVLGVCAILASVCSFEQVSSVLVRFSADGEVASFTRERHFPLRLAMLAWGAVTFGGGFFLDRYSQQVSETCRSFVDGAREFLWQLRTMCRTDWHWLLGLLLLAGGVRGWYIHQPMRYDEAYTYLQYASHPIYEAIAMYWDPNNHLFHTLQVHLATQIFGVSPAVCRLPTWLAGTLLAPVCFLAIRRWGRGIAIVAGLMMALHPMLIEYSTTSRGYMLQTLLGVVLLRLTWTLTSRSAPALFVWCCWVVTTALALWTIPTSVYFVAGAAIWLFMSSRDAGPSWRQTSLALVVAGLLTIVCYTPVFIYSGVNNVTHNEFVRPLTLSEFASRWPASIEQNWSFLFRDTHGAPLLLSLCVMLAAFLFSPERKRLAMLCGSLIAGAGLVILQRVHPPARVWIFLIPPLLLLSAVGCQAVATRLDDLCRQRWLFAILSATLIVSPFLHSIRTDSILLSNEGGVFRDGPAAARVSHERRLPGEPVFAICPAHSPVAFHALEFGLPQEVFAINFEREAQWNSVLFVVNRLNGETVASLFGNFNVSDSWRQGHVEELANFPTGSLVRVTRAPQSTP